MSTATQHPTTPAATAYPSPSLLRLATAGSVDDGKSTLVGRLLHDTKSVLADQMAAVEQASRRRGWTGELADLALLTDGLRAEREQGITIDVAYRYFATARRSFILADCPGHVQYTRNTVTGASTADVVVVLVDARNGVVEQTRRHLAVIGLLRAPHVVVALNKIDLVEDAEAVHAGVSADVAALARTFGIEDVRVVPVSALLGDNVVERSSRTPWYAGPTLLELLETLPAESEVDEPLRFPVQLVIRPQQGAVDPAFVDYRGYAGHVASGAVSVGDEVVVSPSGLRTTVTGIDRGGVSVERAEAPLSVTLRLADQLDISRGDLIAGAAEAPHPVQQAEAVLCWLAEAPLVPGARVLVKHGTRTVRARVTALHERLDVAAMEVVPVTGGAELNDLVRVSLTLAEPLPLEDYALSRDGGSLLVVDPHDGTTLAAGMVGAELRV
ncbi:sulfate adenylyltransferase subunit 1 [Ornithinimicrobium tianjinense]|uniref:sulfate adenylyltransferase n=1 Tax=Ornithinimicrobium tianjinense TaxID=1195761 RepID=A0A917BEG2_9MICO|nr:GTP-binding protein [Ornithinimicrobium tianjinense]GGF37780.1 sulfate adenylyltransferase subunit 1 [Ornithinimicrobium tianjinense]